MSAEEFILGLRRFIARHGTPRKIVSDNAKQFKATKTVLGKAWENVLIDKRVSEFATYQGIDWKYIVELAPWMGGFYERLVGLTKRILRKTIGNKHLTQGQLVTILSEVETVINNGPLVYVDEDINSSPTLTPMDLLSLDNSRQCIHIALHVVSSKDQMLFSSFGTMHHPKYAISSQPFQK